MTETIFDKIISRDTPAEIIYEDDNYLAFNDINPQAPVHIIIIPKKRIPTINDIQLNDSDLIAGLFFAAKNIAIKKGIDQDGYRLVLNCNENGGQSVYHIHLHLIGGRKLSWPPG